MKVLKEVNLDNIKFKLVHGDITAYRADAIVNAANKYLEHGGGVALAIAKAATEGNPDEYTRLSKEELKKQIGKNFIEHGEVVLTPPLALGKIGIKYVIHTVGPRCDGDWNTELKEKLKKAIEAPLRKADELGLKSIAFPVISAGIYGCPYERVIETFLEVFCKFSTIVKNLEEVSLVVYSEEDVNKAVSVMEKIGLA